MTKTTKKKTGQTKKPGVKKSTKNKKTGGTSSSKKAAATKPKAPKAKKVYPVYVDEDGFLCI